MPKRIEVGIDELVDARKDISDDDGVLYKAHVAPRSWNDSERSAVFTVSAEVEDSYRDIVVQAGIDLKARFESNPVALFGHRSWDMPIGSWSDLRTVRSSPKRTEGKITFTEAGIDETADRVARHVQAGTLKACSIGFMPKAVEKILDEEGKWRGGFLFNEVELYEISVVSVPAVRQALIRGASNLKEILSPETIEEFLEHLKANPALAKMIDKGLYEGVYREITGNKTASVLTTSIELDTESLDRLEKIAERMEKAADAVVSGTIELTVETDEPVVDEIAKGIEDSVEKTLAEFEPKVEEIDEPDRKGSLTKLMEGIRGLFKAAEPEPDPAPIPADPEVQKALKERLAKIAAPEAA